MQLDLTDEESAALLTELNHIIENDRYPLSERIWWARSRAVALFRNRKFADSPLEGAVFELLVPG